MKKTLLVITLLFASCGAQCKIKPCGNLLIVSSPIQRDVKTVWPKNYLNGVSMFPRIINPLRVRFQILGSLGKKTEGRRDVRVDRFGNLFIWFFLY